MLAGPGADRPAVTRAHAALAVAKDSGGLAVVNGAALAVVNGAALAVVNGAALAVAKDAGLAVVNGAALRLGDGIFTSDRRAEIPGLAFQTPRAPQLS